MQITITGRHVDVYEGFKDEINDKLPKLEKYDCDIRYIDVVLDKQGDITKMEWKIGVDHHDPIVLTSSGESLQSEINVLFEKAERQLTKLRKKDLEGLGR